MKSTLLFMSFIVCFSISTVLSAQTHVYLLAGQSNMMGKTQTNELPAVYRQTPNNVRFYYQGRERQLADDVYFGPEVAFAHEVATALPHDQHIIINIRCQWQLYSRMVANTTFISRLITAI